MPQNDQVETWDAGSGKQDPKISAMVPSRPEAQAPPKVASKPAPQMGEARLEAAKALRAAYHDLSSAPKYLRIAGLAKDYNEVKARFVKEDFAYTSEGSKRISGQIAKMKEDYNALALQIIRIQDQLGECKSAGMQMDYDLFLKMLDKCTNVLKGGDLDSGGRLVSKFVQTFEQQKEAAIGPVRQDALKRMFEVKEAIQGARKGGIDVSKEEARYKEILDELRKAQDRSRLASLSEQAGELKKMLDFTIQQKQVTDSYQQKISAGIQAVRVDLYEVSKLGLDIRDMAETFERVCKLYPEAHDRKDLEEIDAAMEEIGKELATKKAAMSHIITQRNDMNAKFEARNAKVKELTQRGYVIAVLLNRLEKTQRKVLEATTVEALRPYERFLSNFDAEVASIESQDINEFNLRIVLLQDFELLGALSEKMTEEIEEVTEFTMTFSDDFATAQTPEDFKAITSKMDSCLRQVKTKLGMPIEEAPVEEPLMELEPIE